MAPADIQLLLVDAYDALGRDPRLGTADTTQPARPPAAGRR
ncbi:hypothetical protein [Streptomyces racemochromogenes]